MNKARLYSRLAFVLLSAISLNCMLITLLAGKVNLPVESELEFFMTFFKIGIMSEIIAVILGFVSGAFTHSRKNIESKTLCKLGIVGTHIWFIALICFVMVIFSPGLSNLSFWEAQPRPPHVRIKGDQRTMTIALETYYLDHNNYPAWSLDRTQNFNGGLKDRKGILSHQPTFRMANGSALCTLTTPIAYLTSIFCDTFCPIKGGSLCYWNNATATTTATGFILWSPGPDGVYDLSIDNIPKAYDPKTTVPSNLLIELTYDPSNGTQSRGDIWRAKQ